MEMTDINLNNFKKKSGNSFLKSELSDYTVDELTDYFREKSRNFQSNNI